MVSVEDKNKEKDKAKEKEKDKAKADAKDKAGVKDEADAKADAKAKAKAQNEARLKPDSFMPAKSNRKLEEIMRKPVRSLRGIGDTRAAMLSGLGIETVGDAVGYFPRDYEDRSDLKKISEMNDGDECSFEGYIASNVTEARPRRGMLISRVTVRDETGSITAVFFNQPYIKKIFNQRERYIFFGKIAKKKSLELQNPIYEKINEAENETAKLKKTCRIMPVYSATAGLSQNTIRAVIRASLDLVLDNGGFEEQLPDELRSKYNLADLCFCIENIHFPTNDEAFLQSRRRLVFEELFMLQLRLFSIRESLGRKPEGISFRAGNEVRDFLGNLPYSLTGSQIKVLADLEKDMESSNVMNRLVQGDVGSGKTVLAAAALIKAVKSGYQGTMMAPTGILARQHFETLSKLYEGLDINIALITGNMPRNRKAELLERVADGSINIVVGTHALLEEKVVFKKLGLVVTDEQHRFGVRQRAALAAKGNTPDVLVMTATPIPRTLALILYGDLDISVIDELPPGRKPVETFIVTEAMRERINKFIRKNVCEGHQVFIVCPLVDESEEVDAKSAMCHAQKLAEEEFSDLSVGLIHGRMKPDEKEKVMYSFTSGEMNILVSTTVIEVGVNIPNATLMVIENAERFGLAQLHQLRGRVGRGADRSYCILYNAGEADVSLERLKVMEKTGDGFIIAERDLELRGPGEFFGTRQHGLPELKIANLYRDTDILLEAQTAARDILALDGSLEKPENEMLRRNIEVKGEFLS